MFDLIAGREKHLPSRTGVPIVLSTIVQLSVIGAIVASILTMATEQLPDVPDMLAFVVETPAPPPPPPPPPRAPVLQRRPAQVAETAAPIEPPTSVPVETPPVSDPAADQVDLDFDVPGGVEGGVPGGSIAGVVGGLPQPVPPPPPPPSAPIRIGGQVKAPELLHRVEPLYPPLAVAAHLQGVVILEAVVGREGTVNDLKILRSSGTPVLDREAVAAVRQWRYEPLLLNGRREPFVLTVTLSFNLDSASE